MPNSPTPQMRSLRADRTREAASGVERDPGQNETTMHLGHTEHTTDLSAEQAAAEAARVRREQRAADLRDARARFTHSPAEALTQGGLAARSMFLAHEHIEPTETERDLTALVIAAALALGEDAFAAVGAPTDLNPLDAALMLVASGDEAADSLYGSLCAANPDWAALLAPLEALDYTERAAATLMTHFIIARTIEARERRFRRFAGHDLPH